LHAAADHGHRLRAAPAGTALCALCLGTADRIDGELAELAVEEAVVGAAAEFAVGDEFEAELLLERDSAANGSVFRRGQRRLIDLAAGEAGALGHQFRRPQQAADMLGAERRLRYGLRRGHIGADIHGVTLPQFY
jgi:hypothetical protein